MRRSGSGMPTRLSQSMRLGARRGAAQRACGARSPRRSGRRRVITGFRLVDGSWKIMPMRRAAHVAHPRLGQLRACPCRRAATLPAADAAVLRQQAQDRQRRHALAAAATRRPARRSRRARSPASGRRPRARGRRRSRARPSRSSIVSMRSLAAELTAPSALAARLAGAARNARARGSKASRTPSANRLAASTSATMKANAAAKVHQTTGSRDHLVARHVDHAAEAVRRSGRRRRRRRTAPPRRGSGRRNRARRRSAPGASRWAGCGGA